MNTIKTMCKNVGKDEITERLERIGRETEISRYNHVWMDKIKSYSLEKCFCFLN